MTFSHEERAKNNTSSTTPTCTFPANPPGEVGNADHHQEQYRSDDRMPLHKEDGTDQYRDGDANDQADQVLALRHSHRGHP
jgi:hypothetical protein